MHNAGKQKNLACTPSINRGDVFTGIVQSVDPAHRTLTLNYDHKKRHETFAGVLKPPLEIVDKYNRPSKVRRIEDGDQIEVYFLPKGMKVKEYHKPDYTADDNLIFKIKVLKEVQSP